MNVSKNGGFSSRPPGHVIRRSAGLDSSLPSFFGRAGSLLQFSCCGLCDGDLTSAS